MSSSGFCFTQGDLGPYFAIQLLSVKDGTVIDLTAATVAFYLRHVDSGKAVVTAGGCNVTDAANGKVEYRWTAGDTDVPGMFNAQFRVTFASGLTQSVIIQDVPITERIL